MKKAFTLAEVLITIAVIGVVATMTIPVLVQNYQKEVYVAQLKKTVSVISQAGQKAMQERNVDDLTDSKLMNDAGAVTFLTNYFKIAKNCETSATPCFASSYKNLSGSDVTLETPLIAAILNDGTAMSIWHTSKGTEQYHGRFSFQVDLNGPKGPNLAGRDFYSFDLYTDGKVASSYYYREDDDFVGTCKSSPYGSGCLNAIISSGWKMDY